MSTATAKATVRVLIVDDHPLLREGVAAVLGGDRSFEVVGEAATAREAIDAVEKLQPDIALIDVSLDDGDGIGVCEKIQAQHPRVRLLIITKFTSDRIVVNAFRAGAHGFLVKSAEPDQVREAVRTVANGDAYVDPKVAHAVVKVATSGRRSPGQSGLTSQEVSVLELVANRLDNHEIGEHLGIATETVKSHLKHAMKKLGADDRWSAAKIAQREGLV